MDKCCRLTELIRTETEGPFLSLASGHTAVHHLNGHDNRSQCNELFHERQRQPVYVYNKSDAGQNNTVIVAPPLVYKNDEMCHLWQQRMKVVWPMFHASPAIRLLLAKLDKL